MKKSGSALVLSTVLALSACAQQPDKISASYVSPSTYENRSCNQLMAERNAIVRQVNTLTQEQKEAATTDAVATGVALLLFWPAAFALATTKDNATPLSTAKGHYDAITAQMEKRGCALPPEPAPLMTAPAQSDTRKRSWE
ncbi:MAG: hypothetical protein AB7S99_15310 [Pseudodonghicola sp.]